MADVVLTVAKSLVDGTLIKAQTAIEEEARLRKRTQRDLVFIAGEFQMMQALLSATTVENIKNNGVVSALVSQVRDLAYDVEDGIEFVVHLDTKSDWWRRLMPSCMRGPLPLDEAVDIMEQLKARVLDVSQRNARYNLIGDSGLKPVLEIKQPLAPAGVSSMLLKHQDLDALTELLTKKSSDLQVISVWAVEGDLEAAMIVRVAYDSPEIWENFGCHAYVKIEHPFNLRKIIRNMLDQFYAYSLEVEHTKILDAFKTKAAKAEDKVLQEEFMQQVNNQRYLVVLDGVSTLAEWNAIRKYLPDKNNGSHIVVLTQQFQIANFCTGHRYFQRFSADGSLCIFLKEEAPDTNNASDRETLMDQSCLIGRDVEMRELSDCLNNTRENLMNVTSVWGAAGAGKSSLVRNVYNSWIGRDGFRKYGWVDVCHPFNLMKFCQSLLLELHTSSLQAKHGIYCGTKGLGDPVKECRAVLKNDRCIVIIDDLQSKEDWDVIKATLVPRGSESIIVVITNEASIALHCADSKEFVFNVKGLEAREAIHIFENEVGKANPHIDVQDYVIQTLVLKCGGLPKVIKTLAYFLAAQGPHKWKEAARSMNKKFMYVMETKPEFARLGGLFSWMHSSLGALPVPLKQLVAYTLIFPGHYNIRRRRLIFRWIAEGYSKDSNCSTAYENAEELFSKLVELSMIRPPPHLTSITDMRMVSFTVNSFFREYVISRPIQDNIATAIEVFLGRSCTSTSQSRGRHLLIDESWSRDITVFETTDFWRLRSLTVRGQWQSFFISKSMKFLRVLDLEDATGVTNEDLEKILKVHTRLMFLSLRGCREISYLPSSVGNLRQLQTLDIRHTPIITLPESIIRLTKLQYFRLGTGPRGEPSAPRAFGDGPGIILSKLRRQLFGVRPAPGLGKLRALHTLGVVYVGAAGGEAILEQVGNLSQLHKLGVSGVSNKTSTELRLAISRNAHLESLSLWINEDSQNCLDGMFSIPPKHLQSVKLYGLVDKLPECISMLWKLTKLDLEITMSTKVDMTVIGGLRQLCILRLNVRSCTDGQLDFRVKSEGVEDRSYENVKILKIACCAPLVVSFGSEAMRNLELLVTRCPTTGLTLQFEDLVHLSKLRKVQILGPYSKELKQHFEQQLIIHPNLPHIEVIENW